MQKFKRIMLCVIPVLFIGVLIFGYKLSKNWPRVYKSELDDFFGKGNWKCITEEEKDSIVYKESVQVYYPVETTKEEAGKYTNWLIQTTRSGEDEIWKLTNHTYKINQSKYALFSSKRYSAKQALTRELMDVAFEVISEQIREEILAQDLPKNELDCLRITMSYKNGNPPAKFYSKLCQQSWFHINEISAEKFLSSDLYNFYIDILAYDYRVDNLTESEKEHLCGSMDAIVSRLCAAYGDNASFRIYLDADHTVEYEDGVIVTGK